MLKDKPYGLRVTAECRKEIFRNSVWQDISICSRTQTCSSHHSSLILTPLRMCQHYS